MSEIDNFKVDVDKLSSKVTDLTKKLDGLRKEQDTLNKSFKEGKVSAEEYKKQSEKISAGISSTKKEIKSLSSSLKDAIPGVSKLSNAFKALIANPVVALVGAFMKLKSAIQGNEELQNRMNIAFAKFKPIANWFTNLLDKIATKVVELFEQAVDLVPKLERKLLAFINKITSNKTLNTVFEKLGINLKEVSKSLEQMIENYEKASSVTTKLEQETQKLTAAQRQFAQEQIELNEKIGKLQDELADKENLSYKDRIAKTKELSKYRVELAQKELNLRKEELRIAKEDAALAPNSKEDNDKLAQLEASVASATQKVNTERRKGLKEVAIIEKDITNKRKGYEREINRLRISLIDDDRKREIEQRKQDYENAKEQLELEMKIADEEGKQVLQKIIDLRKKVLDESIKNINEKHEKTITENLNKLNKLISEYNFDGIELDTDLWTEYLLAIKDVSKEEKIIQDRNYAIIKAQKEQNKQWEALDKEYEKQKETVKDRYDTEIDALKYLLDEKKITEAEYNDKKLQIENNYNSKVLELDTKREEKRLILAQNYSAKELLIEQEKNEKIKELQRERFEQTMRFINETANATNAFAQLEMSIAEDETKSDKERDKARRKALNLQIAGTYLAMAESLAQGINTATTSSSNWIEQLIAIASTVAAVVSQIAQVKSLMNKRNSGGYATGGYVSGEGTGTSDSINARLSNGEFVTNQKATQMYRPLLESINRSVGQSQIAGMQHNNLFVAQLATALAAQPAPIVSVESINRQNDIYKSVRAYSTL